MNVRQALELLQKMRAQLGAVSVVATWETRHGDVEVTAARSGSKILVDGQEVPHGGQS